MRKKILISLTSILLLGAFLYVSAGYYVAYSILKIDHTCGLSYGLHLELMLMEVIETRGMGDYR